MVFSLIQDGVPAILSAEAGAAYTAAQIAQKLVAAYPDACQEKLRRSKNAKLKNMEDLQNQIAREIYAHIGTLPHIKIVEGRPRRFYYSEQTDEQDVAASENIALPGNRNSITEADMYLLLAGYLGQEFNLYTKRIDEKKSTNKNGTGGNKWLYPDMVALEDLSRDWHATVRECAKEMAAPKARIWSFEVKKLINRANIREVFFQTVSNSSWANYGYLVAGRIEGAHTIEELRMLCSLHGIGAIELNIEGDIPDGQILIPARLRPDLDLTSASRLVDANKDFQAFITSIRHFHQTGDVPHSGWDGKPEEVD